MLTRLGPALTSRFLSFCPADNGANVGAACKTTDDAVANCANVGVCDENGECKDLKCMDPEECADEFESCASKPCCSGSSCVDVDGNKKCCPQTCADNDCCEGFTCSADKRCVLDGCKDGACTRSCGRGNGDCDVACMAANPDAKCLKATRPNERCNCNNQGGGTQFECNAFPPGFKCCTCTTLES